MFHTSLCSLPLWMALLSVGAVLGAKAQSVLPSSDSPSSASARDSLLREAQASALRLPQRHQEVAPRWEIRAEGFARRGIVSTTDALRQLPGINLRDYGGGEPYRRATGRFARGKFWHDGPFDLVEHTMGKAHPGCRGRLDPWRQRLPLHPAQRPPHHSGTPQPQCHQHPPHCLALAA